MISRIKYLLKGSLLDFYFCLFSRYYLWRWRPKILVITGSVGKTQLLDLLKYQMGEDAYHSHKANTKIGITCQLFGLEGIKPGQRWRWLTLFLLVPWRALTQKKHPQRIYLVEYDIASVFSVRFFKWWLKPHLTVWVSATPAHLQFFDKAAQRKGQDAFSLAVADFATLVKSASEHIFALADNKVMRQSLKSAQTAVSWVELPHFDYKVTLRATLFKFADDRYLFAQPVPREIAKTLVLMKAILAHLKLPIKNDLRGYAHSPSRHTVLAGLKETFLIDSTFNSQLASALAMLRLFKELPGSTKWLVCGDMIEQGQWTESAHRDLAEAIAELRPQRVFLVGHRSRSYIYPRLQREKLKVVSVLEINQPFIDDFKATLKGREVILFKGAGYLYVLLEALLENQADRRLLHAVEKPNKGLIQQII